MNLRYTDLPRVEVSDEDVLKAAKAGMVLIVDAVGCNEHPYPEPYILRVYQAGGE